MTLNNLGRASRPPPFEEAITACLERGPLSCGQPVIDVAKETRSQPRPGSARSSAVRRRWGRWTGAAGGNQLGQHSPGDRAGQVGGTVRADSSGSGELVLGGLRRCG